MRPMYRWVEGFLSPDQCAVIVDQCSAKTEVAGFANEDKKLFKNLTRKCQVSWISEGNTLDPIMQHIVNVFFEEVKTHFNIPLSRVEPIQYTDYDLFGHYKRHSDSGEGPASTRIMSASVQLSDPSDYWGGDLKMYFGKKPKVSPKGQGIMTIFPSVTEHKVTPLWRGRRRSLVLWGHI